MPVAISNPIRPFNSVLLVVQEGLTAVLLMRMERLVDPAAGLVAPVGAVDLEGAVEAAEVEEDLAVAEEDVVEEVAVAEEVSGVRVLARAAAIFLPSLEIAAGAVSNKSKGKLFSRFAIQPSMRGPFL